MHLFAPLVHSRPHGSLPQNELVAQNSAMKHRMRDLELETSDAKAALGIARGAANTAFEMGTKMGKAEMDDGGAMLENLGQAMRHIGEATRERDQFMAERDQFRAERDALMFYAQQLEVEMASLREGGGAATEGTDQDRPTTNDAPPAAAEPPAENGLATPRPFVGVGADDHEFALLQAQLCDKQEADARQKTDLDAEADERLAAEMKQQIQGQLAMTPFIATAVDPTIDDAKKQQDEQQLAVAVRQPAAPSASLPPPAKENVLSPAAMKVRMLLDQASAVRAQMEQATTMESTAAETGSELEVYDGGDTADDQFGHAPPPTVVVTVSAGASTNVGPPPPASLLLPGSISLKMPAPLPTGAASHLSAYLQAGSTTATPPGSQLAAGSAPPGMMVEDSGSSKAAASSSSASFSSSELIVPPSSAAMTATGAPTSLGSSTGDIRGTVHVQTDMVYVPEDAIVATSPKATMRRTPSNQSTSSLHSSSRPESPTSMLPVATAATDADAPRSLTAHLVALTNGRRERAISRAGGPPPPARYVPPLAPPIEESDADQQLAPATKQLVDDVVNGVLKLAVNKAQLRLTPPKALRDENDMDGGLHVPPGPPPPQEPDAARGDTPPPPPPPASVPTPQQLGEALSGIHGDSNASGNAGASEAPPPPSQMQAQLQRFMAVQQAGEGNDDATAADDDTGSSTCNSSEDEDPSSTLQQQGVSGASLLAGLSGNKDQPKAVQEFVMTPVLMLHACLGDEVLCGRFLTSLQSEYAEENLLFWKDVQAYREEALHESTGPEVLQGVLLAIYTR